MKKLVSIILTLLTVASLAIGLAGCKKEEKKKYTPTVFTITVSENVASEPLVVMDDFDNLYSTVLISTESLWFTNYFYHLSSFRYERFFLIEADAYTNYHYGNEIVKVLSDTEFKVYISPKKYGDPSEYIAITESYSITNKAGNNINFNFVHLPLNNYNYTPQVTLEFGEEAFENDIYSNFINLYFDEVCTTSCYYKSETQMSKDWFESYFNSFLIDYLNLRPLA